MKGFSQRNRAKMRTALKVILWILAGTLFVAILAFTYLQRYMVYTTDGVYLEWPSTQTESEPATAAPAPAVDVTPDIVYESPAPASSEPVSEVKPLSRLNGVYLAYTDLLDLTRAEQICAEAEEGTDCFVFQMKRDHGSLTYRSASYPQYSEDSAPDQEEFSQFLKKLKLNNVYLMAEISCFRDDVFALANMESGIHMAGGALWMDSQGYYWLDPAAPDTLDYLKAIASELADMGFDEIIVANFSFPESSSGIIYNSEKSEILQTAAEDFAKYVQGLGLNISFKSDADTCTEGESAAGAYTIAEMAGIFDRICLDLDDGMILKALSETLSSKNGGNLDPETEVVLFTKSADPRFDGYSIIHYTYD